MSAALKALRGSAAIAGAATFGCGEAPGFTDIELLARAARAAVADAGLTMRDIDGLCTASAATTMWPMPVAEYLGLRPTDSETGFDAYAFLALYRCARYKVGCKLVGAASP